MNGSRIISNTFMIIVLGALLGGILYNIGQTFGLPLLVACGKVGMAVFGGLFLLIAVSGIVSGFLQRPRQITTIRNMEELEAFQAKQGKDGKAAENVDKSGR